MSVGVTIDNNQDYGINHGQIFDDHRRWCICCQKPVKTLPFNYNDEWQHKTCPSCTSLWLEYEEEIRNLIFDTDDIENSELL